MRTRSVLAVLAACILLSTGIGFAFGSASQPESATAAKGKRIHKEIKRNVTRARADIKRLDRKVDRVENGIGTTGTTSLADRLVKVERNTAKICREVGTFC
jgi:peptidoglycan hydrolase CwlO-like protein